MFHIDIQRIGYEGQSGMLRFSHEVGEALHENANERARYLWTLFSEALQRTHPKFYCDIGAGLGYNTLVFRRKASKVLAIDLKFCENNVLRNNENVNYLIVADANCLPLKKEIFDIVSAFSVIEHTKNKEVTLKEILRVLTSGGYLAIQIPNRYFPLDLHLGLPLVFFIPAKIRYFLLRIIHRERLSAIDVPSLNRLLKMIRDIEPKSETTVKKVIYPASIVWSRMRFVYRFAKKMRVFNLIPSGIL